MSEILSVMSVAEVPAQYTGIAQFGGIRMQPYSVWVCGLICCYNKTLALSEIDLAKELRLLERRLEESRSNANDTPKSGTDEDPSDAQVQADFARERLEDR